MNSHTRVTRPKPGTSCKHCSDGAAVVVRVGQDPEVPLCAVHAELLLARLRQNRVPGAQES